MAENYIFKKENLDELTLEHFKMVAIACMSDKIKTVAPLGFGGDSFYMFGEFITSKNSEDGHWHRASVVNFRNYCGTLEMLITDKIGNFLIYTKIDGLSFDELVEEYYREFCLVKDKIETITTETFDESKINYNNLEFSEGWNMLLAYMKDLELKKDIKS